MIQPRERLRLAAKTPAGALVGQRPGGKHLERDITTEHLVVAAVDDAHPTLAESLADAEMPEQLTSHVRCPQGHAMLGTHTSEVNAATRVADAPAAHAARHVALGAASPREARPDEVWIEAAGAVAAEQSKPVPRRRAVTVHVKPQAQPLTSCGETNNEGTVVWVLRSCVSDELSQRRAWV